MSKPVALTDAEIADIELRLKKGWVVRAFEYEPLLAMARERNRLMAAQAATTEQPNHGLVTWGTGVFP